MCRTLRRPAHPGRPPAELAAAALIDELDRLNGLGFEVAIGAVPQAPRLDVLEKIGADVIPVVAAF